jgi:octaprenyl-diphosphate synthase
MSELTRIQQPIRKSLTEFEIYFRDSLRSKIPLLEIVTRYILRRKGKQMRPTLVLLSASMLGEINESSYTAAALIELLHTASLVHDDVVDESYERRGFFSLNALWKSKLAVLVGDFLLAKGLLLSVSKKEYALLEIVSEAVQDMSEGEILQIQKVRRLNISMDDYFEIIRKKTAALIGACAASGARSVNASDEDIKSIKEFGILIGIAFQIKDDLFDYKRSGKIGKPTANDIKEKKMTLPLIYALQNSSKSESRKIKSLISRDSKNSGKIDEIINFVSNHGGIEYAERMMQEYKKKALEILSAFPANASRESLEQFVEYTTSRAK